MPCCFAPGCSNGSANTRRQNKKMGIRNPSLFTGPKDAQLLEIWRKVIPRTDRKLTPNDRVCELHFTEDCIERFFETKLTNGTTSVTKRIRPHLKPGSVPTLFPNSPYYLNRVFVSNSMKRENTFSDSMVEDIIPERTNKRKIETHTFDSQKISKIFQAKVQGKQFSYMQLVEHLKQVHRPDLWWTVSQCESFVICAKWNDTYCTDKKVVVCQDLSAKVFLRNKEAKTLKQQIYNIENLSSLLLTVDKLIICKSGKLKNS